MASNEYREWLDECLEVWNDRYGDSRILLDDAPDGYDPATVIEFGENGDAYPHGPGGTGHVRAAVPAYPGR